MISGLKFALIISFLIFIILSIIIIMFMLGVSKSRKKRDDMDEYMIIWAENKKREKNELRRNIL